MMTLTRGGQPINLLDPRHLLPLFARISCTPVVLALCAATLLSQPLSAEPSSYQKEALAFSLLDAYEVARESNPDVAIARYRVDGADAQKDVARGSFLPQVSIFGDWSENRVRYDGSATSQLPAQEYPGERYGLQMRFPLLKMRSYREFERQQSLLAQSEHELAVAESDLLKALVEAYLYVLLTQETEVQVETELRSLELQLEEANALLDKSLLPITQVLEARTRADQVAADLVNARGNASIARESFSQLVGRRDMELRPILDHVPLMVTIAGADEAAQLAYRFDPAIAAAEDGLKAARKAISRENGTWWPEVEFVYNTQYSDVGFDNLISPPRSSETYSISMRYPLFEGGAGVARTKGAWAQYYVLQYELEAARREADGRARAAWVNLATTEKRVSAAEQAVKTAEVSVEASRQAVKAGTARLTDVIIALAQRTAAQRDLTESRYLKVLEWLELELATGSSPEVLAPRLSRALHGQ